MSTFMVDRHRAVDSATIECVIDRLYKAMNNGAGWLIGDPSDRIRGLFPEFYKTIDELRNR